MKSNGAGKGLCCAFPDSEIRLKLSALEFEAEAELDPTATVGKRLSRLVGTNCVEMTPKLAFWVRLRVGSAKFTWLKMLKKSAWMLIETRSVSAVFLPNDESRFQNGSPWSGLERPVRPSLLICTLRKSPNITAGSANRLRPLPLLAGLPGVPIPFEPATPPCTELPKVFGFTVGIKPTANPKMLPPPHTWLLSVTKSGRPLNAEKIPVVYHPPRSRLAKDPPLNRCPLPMGKSYT